MQTLIDAGYNKSKEMANISSKQLMKSVVTNLLIIKTLLSFILLTSSSLLYFSMHYNITLRAYNQHVASGV